MSNVESKHTIPPVPSLPPKMSSRISSLLSSFQESARELNAESDVINKTLNTVQERLVYSSAGIPCWFPRPLSTEETTESTRLEQVYIERRLGFAKANGNWCLAVKGIKVRSGYFQGDTNCPYTNESLASEPMPLAQARRDERVKALEFLPEFIELMNSEVKKATQTIRESKELA